MGLLVLVVAISTSDLALSVLSSKCQRVRLNLIKIHQQKDRLQNQSSFTTIYTLITTQ